MEEWKHPFLIKVATKRCTYMHVLINIQHDFVITVLPIKLTVEQLLKYLCINKANVAAFISNRYNMAC